MKLPPKIEEWNEFSPSAQDEDFDENPPDSDPLLSSSDFSNKVQLEKCELEFLFCFLWSKLE
jgi:hypothetical protein